jgi:hypothetical protein
MSIAKQVRAAMLLAPLFLAGTVGCSSARYVMQDQFGGVVAIPSNTNSWPTNYRDEAEKLMREKCPQGYVIEREEEVTVGQTTTSKTNNDTKSYDVPGGRRSPSGTVTTTTTDRSVAVQDKTEYRITFHAATIPATAMPPAAAMPATVRVVAPPPPPGLASTPVPVGN